jgi:guanine deaminase
MYETRFMRRVLELSERGMQSGHGGPFGCVIVKDGVIVGEAHNEVLSSNDPTAHAELLAVRRASRTLKTFNLSGCALYTNGAPASIVFITCCRWTIPAPSVSATSLFTRSSRDRSINAKSSR